MGFFNTYILLTMICISCYWHAMDGDFVFDDSVAIVKNKDVTTMPTNFSAIFTNDYWGTSLKSKDSHKSYRPLTTLMYHTEYAKFKFRAKEMRLVNLFLHIVNTLLLYRFLNQFDFAEYSSRSIPVISSIIFALHPIHTEPICGIVGRADLMFGLIFLMALMVTTLNRKLSQTFEISVISVLTLIGVLYKETAITIPLACIFCDYMKRRIIYKPIKTQICWLASWRTLYYTLVTLTLIWFRLWLQDFEEPIFKPMDNPVASSDSLVTRIFSQNYLYAINLWIMIFPYWLSFDWALGCISLIRSIFDLRLQAVLFMYICITLVMINYKRAYAIILGMGFTIIPFLPASGIIKVGFVIAERILYVPSIGFCIILGYTYVYLSKYFRKKPLLVYILRGVGIFVLLFYYMRTQQRATEWMNEETLYSSALNVCPNNAKVHYNIARLATDKNDKETALKHYHRAIELYPEYEAALMNLGNVYRDIGNLKEAEKYLKASIEAHKEFPTAWMNLGIVNAAMKNYNEALECYRKALEYNKNYATCYYNMGNLFLEQNRDLEAIHHWQYATHIEPKQAKAWTNILNMLDNKGLFEDALRMSEKALRVLPNETNILFQRANILGKMKRYAEAEGLYLKAIKLQPRSSLYRTNLGVLYHRWGKLDNAVKMYRKAIEIDPKETKTAQENLKRIIINYGQSKAKNKPKKGKGPVSY